MSSRRISLRSRLVCGRIARTSLWILVAATTVGTSWLPTVLGQDLANQLQREAGAAIANDVLADGDAKRGAVIFFRPELACARCHETSEGRRLGPNLAERREVTPEHLIQSVLKPSAVIREGYQQELFQLLDGRQIAGIIAEENDSEILLDRIEEPGEPLRIHSQDVDQRRTLPESSMPIGLASLLNNRQEFLDLVCYLKEIADQGPARAAQLRPAHAMTSLPPLPEYERNLDHRQLVSDNRPAVISQGQEIYRLICSSCHGDLQNEGSMPTSLRFATGKFKRGNDPYSMYLTLTHGYGLMLPQRQLVPRQKYAVIHYIRQHFLKDHNPDQYFAVNDAYLSELPTGDGVGPEPILRRPWTEMDYGPSFFNTIEVAGSEQRNIAQKGLTVRLDPGSGGVAKGSHWILYDHDTLRMAAIWRGKFIDFNGIHFNGVHARHPKITGQVLFENPDLPGWNGPDGQGYQAPRTKGRDGRLFGPVPRQWAQYHGLHRYGNRSVLNYSVNGVAVQESPEMQVNADVSLVIRQLKVGPRKTPLVMRVTDQSDGALINDAAWISQSGPDDRRWSFDGRRYLEHSLEPEEQERLASGFSFTARVRTRTDGTIVAYTTSQEDWMPNGRTFFVRNGRLGFDIGWVGAVTGKRKVNDGRWHQVRADWNARTGETVLWIDGQQDAVGELRIKEELSEPVLRIGYTQANFPASSNFEGEMESVSIRSWDKRDQETSEWNWTPSAPEDNRAWQQLPGQQDEPNRFVSVGHGSTAKLLPGEGFLELEIPAGDQPMTIPVVYGFTDQPLNADRVKEICQTLPEANFDLWTGGGSASWPTVLETTIQEFQKAGGLIQDKVLLPVQNPWNCRLRLTGIDFIPGTPDAMVCAWDGSVWRVNGIRGKAGEPVRWQRVACGLFQPLGIRFRDGQLFVTCRDQLVHLRDLNDDGEYDHYRCFNNDHQVTEHFHEFAMGLQTDDDGNFYYAKSARHALPALVPHHGTLLKISADGKQTQIIANGFRAANGVCLNPDGSFVVTDQEGHWNPKNRINWVTPGKFYGNMFGYHSVTDESDAAMEPPLCWITNEFDRSPAELLWVDSQKWGPLNGKLLNLSYGYGKMYVVPFEEKSDGRQGGMCAFDMPAFETGVMRGRFHPDDGHLYCCGMFAWSSTQEKPGGLYRLRASGEPFHLPVDLKTATGKVQITFSEKLDRDSVQPNAFAIQAWDLKRTANYGSEHYNQRTWDVTSARLESDGKTVTLAVPELTETWGMEIAFSLKDAEGKEFQNRIHNTINYLEDDGT